MDSEELGESSSSPSAKIVQIQRKKRTRPGAELRVFFSDDNEIDVAARVWESRPFHEGDVLTEEEIETIRRQSILVQTREHALAFLSRKEESRFTLQRKLMQRHYPADVIAGVLSDLEAKRLLDDARFAREWLRSRLRRRAEGERVLVAGLRRRGVSQQTAAAALAGLLDEEPDLLIDAAERLLDRIDAGGTLGRDQLRYQLRGAGFSSETAGEALERRFSE